VVLVTQDAEVRRIVVQSQPRQKTLSQKQKTKKITHPKKRLAEWLKQLRAPA
jgi:hypothetical protein